MLCIHVYNLEYDIEYRLDGVRLSRLLTTEYRVAMEEIGKKLKLEMGLAKGKIYAPVTKKGISDDGH